MFTRSRARRVDGKPVRGEADGGGNAALTRNSEPEKHNITPSSSASALDQREFPLFPDGKSLQEESASEPTGPGPAAPAPSARLQEALRVPLVAPPTNRSLRRLAELAFVMAAWLRNG